MRRPHPVRLGDTYGRRSDASRAANPFSEREELNGGSVAHEPGPRLQIARSRTVYSVDGSVSTMDRRRRAGGALPTADVASPASTRLLQRARTFERIYSRSEEHTSELQ